MHCIAQCLTSLLKRLCPGGLCACSHKAQSCTLHALAWNSKPCPSYKHGSRMRLCYQTNMSTDPSGASVLINFTITCTEGSNCVTTGEPCEFRRIVTFIISCANTCNLDAHHVEFTSCDPLVYHPQGGWLYVHMHQGVNSF